MLDDGFVSYVWVWGEDGFCVCDGEDGNRFGVGSVVGECDMLGKLESLWLVVM